MGLPYDNVESWISLDDTSDFDGEKFYTGASRSPDGDGVPQRSDPLRDGGGGWVGEEGDNEAGGFLPVVCIYIYIYIYTYTLWARFVVFRLFRFSLVDRGAVRRRYYPG